MRLKDLFETKVRFFTDDDMIELMPRNDGQPHKAYRVKGKKGDFWIPMSNVQEIDVADEYTGEIVHGYWVSEYWRNKDPKIKTLRRSKTDYKDISKETNYITI